MRDHQKAKETALRSHKILRDMYKENDASDYIYLVDGIKGEDEFGQFQHCHYKPVESAVVGIGCYRTLPHKLD